MSDKTASVSDAEWAASLSVEDLDLLINRCVHERDMKGISAALHLMAVKDPARAEHWRSTLLLAVEVAQARHATTQKPDTADAMLADLERRMEDEQNFQNLAWRPTSKPEEGKP
jgi:hypothetical protein